MKHTPTKTSSITRTGREVTLTATQLRPRLFKLASQLADGELDRVVITRPNGRPLQMTYEGRPLPSDWSALAARTKARTSGEERAPDGER